MLGQNFSSILREQTTVNRLQGCQFPGDARGFVAVNHYRKARTNDKSVLDFLCLVSLEHICRIAAHVQRFSSLFARVCLYPFSNSNRSRFSGLDNEVRCCDIMVHIFRAHAERSAQLAVQRRGARFFSSRSFYQLRTTQLLSVYQVCMFLRLATRLRKSDECKHDVIV